LTMSGSCGSFPGVDVNTSGGENRVTSKAK
jgi:hypothetical protein